MNNKVYVLIAAVALLIVFMSLFGKTGVKEIRKMPRFTFWEVIYSDLYDGKISDSGLKGTLYSLKYDLQGKPDLIYRHKITKEILPVEIKSGNTDYPHKGDLLQLGVYMLIVEDVCSKKPKKAIISYKNKTFVIRNTHKVRKMVLNTAQRMRNMLLTGEEEPNSSFANCRHCICDGTVCDYGYCPKFNFDE